MSERFRVRWYHWALIGVLLVAVIFGILQPFIWMQHFGKPPPSGAISLSVLLSVALALVAVGVAAFAFLAYRDLEHRLRESLEEEIVAESRSALTRVAGNLAFSSWRAWRINTEDLELIKGSISTQIWSLQLVEKLKPTEVLTEETQLQMKSNIAGYTAYMGKRFPDEVKAGDIATARKLGREAYERSKDFGDNYDWKANYAGLLAIFGTSDEKQLSRKIKQELEQRVHIGEISPREWREYNELLEDL